MPENKEVEWLGEAPPHLPSKYKESRFDKGFHRPTDCIKRFSPLDSSYDTQILSVIVASLIIGYSIGYFHSRKNTSERSLGFLN